MTPEARASFYEAMYRAKCESYDILWREVEKLLEPTRSAGAQVRRRVSRTAG